MDKQKVTSELMEACERLLKCVPPEVADDDQIKANILIYLKLGGERLARQYLQMIRKVFPEKILLIKKKPPDESGENAENTDTDKAAVDDKDEDDDDDDDDVEDVEEDDSFGC